MHVLNKWCISGMGWISDGKMGVEAACALTRAGESGPALSKHRPSLPLLA